MASSLENYLTKKYTGKKKKEKFGDSSIKTFLKTPNSPDDSTDTTLPQATEKCKEKDDASDVNKILDPKHGDGIAIEMKLKEEKMRKELQKLKKLSKNDTIVYRDSLGNIISENEAKKEEENKDYKRKRDLEREENIAKRNKNEDAIERERQMRERLHQIRKEGINVYENDKEFIEKQKAEIKEEDPALLFDKKIIRKHKSKLDKQFISITGRKLYKDPTRYPINRFNIKPGWRWDGIVRGNGYEQKWFEKNTK